MHKIECNLLLVVQDDWRKIKAFRKFNGRPYSSSQIKLREEKKRQKENFVKLPTCC